MELKVKRSKTGLPVLAETGEADHVLAENEGTI